MHDDKQVWARRPNAPAAGTRLGPLDEIADGAAKEYVFGAGINAFRMFVVRKGAQAYGYLNLCPHYSLPLNHRDDEFLTRDGGRIMCRQHLALFRIEDGACLDGACEGRALDKTPVRVEQGVIFLGTEPMPYFVFRGYDRPDAEGDRIRVREAHRAYIRQPAADCRVAAGGPVVDDAGERMTGTLIVLEATDRAAALRFLAGDPYASVSLFERTELHRWQWGMGQPAEQLPGA